MAGSDLPDGWDPLKDHYKTSNVYRCSKVVTRRDGSESESSDEKERNLFVANIPSRITTDGLINLFGASGKIQEIRLVPDKNHPQNQLGFVKTFTSADGLRIIEQFHNFKIGGNILRVHVQRPRRPVTENSSDFDRPSFHQSNAPPPPAPLNAASSLQPEGSRAGSEPHGAMIDRSPSSSFGEERLKPVGRSKLILATALRQHEPPVGQLRAGTKPSNGASHHPSSLSRSSSSDEHGAGEPARTIAKQPESQRPAFEPQSNGSKVSEKVSPGSQVRRKGPCLKCKKMGDKSCGRCKAIYCSKTCQKEDFPFHRIICEPFTKDEEELQERFEFFNDNTNEHGYQNLSETQPTVLALNVAIKVTTFVPAMSPSRFYILPDGNLQQLRNLGLRLKEHYSMPKNCKKPQNSPDIGDLCACQYSVDEEWYRVEVEDVVSSSRVIVRYVDYGNEEEVEISTLCELLGEFKPIPKFAVLCGLANIEPIPAQPGCAGWSARAIELSQRIIHPQCIAMVTPVVMVSGVCYVEMTMIGSGDNDVAEMFINAGLARRAKKGHQLQSLPAGMPELLSSSGPSSSPAQLPSSRPLPSPNDKLPSSRPSPNDKLPSSRPSPNEKLLSSRPLPSPGQLPLSGPSRPSNQLPSSGPLPSPDVSPNLTAFGWPADLSRLVGKEMSFQVVEYSPPAGLWVRINPLPGCETMPLVHLSLNEKYRLTPVPRPSSSCSLLSPLTPNSDGPGEPRWRRVTMNDLPVLELKNKLNVEVTLPKDPADFWCHDLEQMAPVAKLQTSLRPHSSSPPPNSFQPEKGDICFGFYEKYNEWYRVVVSEKKHNSVDVLLIDYGEKLSIPLNHLRPLPFELSHYPAMAFQCQLSVWSSLQSSSFDVTPLFKDLVQNKVVSCKILARNASTMMHSVVLSDFTSGQSIASTLIDAIERN